MTQSTKRFGIHSVATVSTLCILPTIAAAGTTESSDEIRAMVAEVMADSETRSSLLAANAGHDGHFHITNGDFRLQVEGQLQFRYTANFRDDDTVVNDDEFESGFTTNRTALAFSGNVFSDPGFIYRVSGNFDRTNGAFDLEDAYVGHAFDNGLIMIWGQLRMPVLWEDVVSEQNALAVDYSVMNAVFRQDRSQGIWLHYSTDDWRGWVGFSDGIRSENTDFNADATDWALTARGEFKFDGDWSQFDAFSSAPGSDFATKLGLATHWQGGPDNHPVFADATVGAFTADLMVEGDGWNLYGAGVALYTDPDGADDTTDYGFVAQGGWFIPDTDWELFGRYDVVIPDSDRAGDDAFNTITVGANHYIHGQAAKFSVDLQYFFDSTTDNDLAASIAGSSVGDRVSLLPSDEEGQFALRAQFQLLF